MEKRILEALQRVIEVQTDSNNYGMLSTKKYRFDDIKILKNAGVNWSDGNTITQNGKPILKIDRRYAARKINGMYKELKPKLEAIL